MGEEYQRLAPEFVGALFDLRAPGGNVWVSDDLATVAMWESPSGDDDEQRTKKAWARYVSLAGEEAHERLVAYKTALAAVCPADRYWYLGVLATHPARQGEGLATAALMPILDEADRLGIPCCLETSTVVNRRFYRTPGLPRVDRGGDSSRPAHLVVAPSPAGATRLRLLDYSLTAVAARGVP